MIDLRLGDCRDVLKTLADTSVDSVVTDPPYEISFMGRTWDASGIAYDVGMWREVLRVLKPGGHLLAFGGDRTHHRLACAIEDAGFEIRTTITWLFGSGFPKSLDVGKAIDKRGGAQVAWFGPWFRQWRDANGVSQKEVAALFPSKTGGLTGCVANWELGFNMPTPEQFNLIRDTFALPFESIEEAEREVIGERTMIQGGGNALQIRLGERREVEANITAPATEAARRWQGWGTALKPAAEYIVMARKPLIGTVAENVLAFGTGAINVDGCRVNTDDDTQRPGSMSIGSFTQPGTALGENHAARGWECPRTDRKDQPLGRWPANVITDGSAEVLAGFPETGPSPRTYVRNVAGDSAARFFYTAKADAADRSEGCETPSNHPTVKPTELMRYLCRLVTQPGGVVLDPFMGSGSTGKAAALERFDFIGIEREVEYLEIARARIAWLGVAPSVDGSVAPPAPVTATGAQLALEFA